MAGGGRGRGEAASVEAPGGLGEVHVLQDGGGVAAEAVLVGERGGVVRLWRRAAKPSRRGGRHLYVLHPYSCVNFGILQET